jgi:tRNA-dependent cyclodipeptide synthase
MQHKMRVLRHEDIKDLPTYVAHYEKYRDLLQSNSVFRNYLYQTIDQIRLPNQQKIIYPEIAAQYFLHELPLVLNSPSVFSVSSSTVVYHNVAGLFKFFFDQNMNEANQGCVEVRIQLDGEE